MKFKEKIAIFNDKHGLTIDSKADEKLPVAFNIFKEEFGYQKSMEQMKSIDKDENPIPWFTYPAIEYLSQFDLKDKNIFEYGCGSSSLFWSKRAKSVTSVEHNIKWIGKLAENKPENLTIRHIMYKNEYEQAVLMEDIKFDIIVIDGNFARENCATHAIKALKSGGMIIFDNSERCNDREDYKEATQILRDANLIQIDFFGFGPIKEYTWCTSVFLTRDFNFKNSNPTQPTIGVGNI